MVVAAFSGTKSTGGYSLEIVAVHASTHSVIVDYRETQPSPKAFVVQVLTQTYAIRVIPKTDLPITFHRLP